MSDEAPKRPSTLTFGAVAPPSIAPETFAEDFEAWMRRAQGYLGFTEEQITVTVQHARAAHEKWKKR